MERSLAPACQPVRAHLVPEVPWGGGDVETCGVGRACVGRACGGKGHGSRGHGTQPLSPHFPAPPVMS